MKPRLSIIVPMYNRRAYIEECVASIRRQTYTDWELWLVDDASTDGTVDLCRDLMQADSRIKLAEQPYNQGVSAARNLGLEMAQGDYITFVDSDDYLLPEGLAHMMRVAAAAKADVVWSRGRYYDQGAEQPLLTAFDGSEERQGVRQLPLDIGARITLIFQHSGWIGAVWNRIYRRDFLEQHHLRFAKLSANEDTLFNFICLCKARKYLITDELYYVYRLSEDSILRKEKTLDNLEVQVQDTFRLTELLWQKLEELPYFSEHPEMREMVMERVIGYMLEMPCLWGFFPTPAEYQQVVAKSVREALEADFGDKAWLVQYLYRQYMEQQGRGRK